MMMAAAHRAVPIEDLETTMGTQATEMAKAGDPMSPIGMGQEMIRRKTRTIIQGTPGGPLRAPAGVHRVVAEEAMAMAHVQNVANQPPADAVVSTE